MFYKNGKFYGDDYSLAFPNGLSIIFDSSYFAMKAIEFVNKESYAKYHINIVFDKSTRQSLSTLLKEEIEDMECEIVGQIFTVTRGCKSGVAAYYQSAISDYYEERYFVKDGKKEFQMCFVVWTSLTDNPKIKRKLCEIDDDTYIRKHFKTIPVREILECVEVKEFFNSITFTD